MAVYTVDFGHCLSGSDTGAGGNGLREEVLTRRIGNLVVQGLIAKGHIAYPIQLESANSVAQSLNYRVDKIKRIEPVQSISIHINAGGGTGVEVWGDNLCKDMCNRICSNIATGFDMDNRGFKNGCESLALVGLYGSASIPALLVECFFIDNKEDCNKLNIQKYADCIVAGILNQAVKQNNTIIEEGVKYNMKNVVVFTREFEGDGILAEFWARTLSEGIAVNNYKLIDWSKVENIYAIGGKIGTYTGYLKPENFVAGGVDGWATLRNLQAKLGK
ncbi:N-acetylmuramoyl-L-alanine amidase [Clostridium gasigenes]|uniref:N-acetylmuramoyl-L-alanine amidase n=1 Tax=Clostridium gasigenes TaxID=94869 RepID=A0A1H0N790_9CLOT|nr:N-acetylmuramoyl-L-alanine amidase [Clostridium gasigenes]SDO88508.1 N-acetylmuramoyl-L-alanine amidase [Clostridium gasigenes]